MKKSCAGCKYFRKDKTGSQRCADPITWVNDKGDRCCRHKGGAVALTPDEASYEEQLSTLEAENKRLRLVEKAFDSLLEDVFYSAARFFPGKLSTDLIAEKKKWLIELQKPRGARLDEQENQARAEAEEV